MIKNKDEFICFLIKTKKNTYADDEKNLSLQDQAQRIYILDEEIYYI